MKHSGHTARNVAIGMALGAVAATVGTELMHTNKRQLKKTTGKREDRATCRPALSLC